MQEEKYKLLSSGGRLGMVESDGTDILALHKQELEQIQSLIIILYI